MPHASTIASAVMSRKLTIENLASRFRFGPLKGRIELLHSDAVANLRVAAVDRTLGELNSQPRAAHDPAHAPGLYAPVHKNDLAFLAQEDNIKRVAHEEHVYGVARLDDEAAAIWKRW